MAGKTSRNKGAAFERKVANMIHDYLGFKVKRDLVQYQEKGRGDLIGLPGMFIECKRYAAITRGQVNSWWSEVVIKARANQAIPVLIYKADRQPIRVVVSASDFIHEEMYDFPIEMDFHTFHIAFKKKIANVSSGASSEDDFAKHE